MLMRAKGAKVGVAHEDSPLSEGGTDRPQRRESCRYILYRSHSLHEGGSNGAVSAELSGRVDQPLRFR